MDLMSIGLVFILFGSIGTAGLIPLAFFGVNTVSVSNTNVDVTSSGSVSYDTTLTSNWNASLNIEVWAQVKTATGVIIAGPTLSTTTLGAYETQTISGPIGGLTPSQNGYTLELFVWSATDPLAPVTKLDFRVGPQIDIVILPGTIGGSTVPGAGTYTISAGSSYLITAIPTHPFVFDYWAYTRDDGIQGSNQINPYNLNTEQGVTIQAFFRDTSIPFETLIVRTEGSGTTNPPPGTYSDVYKRGDDAVLTAIPDSGQALDYWSVVRTVGGDYTDPKTSILLSVDGYTTATAHFKEVILAKYDLNIVIFPSDGGTTNIGFGTFQYDGGTEVRLTSDANPGFTFERWDVNGDSYGGPIKILMDREYDVTVYFEGGNWYSLDLFAIRWQDGNIDQELLEGDSKQLLSGQTVYREGSKIRLVATPSNEYGGDYVFVHWTLGPGDEHTETSREIILIMDRNWDATAQFRDTSLDEEKPEESAFKSIIFPILIGLGIFSMIGSFYIPGGSRLTAGGRFSK